MLKNKSKLKDLENYDNVFITRTSQAEGPKWHSVPGTEEKGQNSVNMDKGWHNFCETQRQGQRHPRHCGQGRV